MHALPSSEGKIGIDLGLTHFAIASTGEKVSGPKAFAKYEKKLAKAQRALAKKKKGSANRKKARLRVAKIHARIADVRKDFLHQLSTRWVRENQVIAIETLGVANMQKTVVWRNRLAIKAGRNSFANWNTKADGTAGRLWVSTAGIHAGE